MASLGINKSKLRVQKEETKET